jgi:hypothetical protein
MNRRNVIKLFGGLSVPLIFGESLNANLNVDNLPVLKFEKDGTLNKDFTRNLFNKVTYKYQYEDEEGMKEIKVWVLEKDAFICSDYVVWGEVLCALWDHKGNAVNVYLSKNKNSFKKRYNCEFMSLKNERA